MSHKKRPTIGVDPLDLMIPAAPRTSDVASAPKGRKVRATFHIPEELFEEARDAAVHLCGPPLRLTLAAIAERGIRAEVERLKKEHNGNKPFPRRQSDLKGGRPIGS
jgi:hypothetical protein